MKDEFSHPDQESSSSSPLPSPQQTQQTQDMLDQNQNYYYYYQNPATGTVSNQPMSLSQLIKLLVPVRVGLSPILPAHTQCLAYDPTSGTTPQEGEWKPASTLRVLKEASCTQWHAVVTTTTSHDGSSAEGVVASGEDQRSPSTATMTTTTQQHGPLTCRSLIDLLLSNPHPATKVLLYAPDVTSEWTTLDQLPCLGLVLDTLRGAGVPLPPISLSTSTNDNDNNDENEKASATTVNPVDGTTAAEVDSQAIQDELEAFLSSTARTGQTDGHGDNDDDDDNDQAYESDGGTKYVKEPLSGRWIHEALAPPSSRRTNADSAPNHPSISQSSTTSTTTAVNNNNTNKTNNKNKKNKDPFHKRNARNWIYVTGLAPTAQLSEIQKFFGRVGLLDLDPETLQPKIKLYRKDDGTLKGDASICYARPESVDLALQVLDESPWDQDHILKVERASFQAKKESVTGTTTNGADDETNGNHKNHSGQKRERKKKVISLAQRKVARLALLQAQDEGFGERLAGGRKGLRIVVVQSMLDGIPETEWESKIQEYCQEWDVEKITCISKTKVVIVKFVEPPAASKAVETWNGMVNSVTKQPMKALYWDGVTDYTQSHEEDQNNHHEEDKRHDEFGKWLDDQDEEGLPPELRLQVAED